MQLLRLPLPINAAVNRLFQHPGAFPLGMYAVHHVLGVSEKIHQIHQLQPHLGSYLPDGWPDAVLHSFRIKPSQGDMYRLKDLNRGNQNHPWLGW